MTDTDTDPEAEVLQETLRTNVKVLMALHGISSARELARLMARTTENHVSRQLAGGRGWRIADLPALARVFGVTPAALLGGAAELVGAAQPAASAGPVNRAASTATSIATVIPFPLHRITARGINPISTSAGTVTSVTAAVGT